MKREVVENLKIENAALKSALLTLSTTAQDGPCWCNIQRESHGPVCQMIRQLFPDQINSSGDNTENEVKKELHPPHHPGYTGRIFGPEAT